MIRVLLSVISTALFSLSATAAGTDTVEEVMTGFHQAVVSHDGEKLRGFFLPEGTAWFNVLTEEALARARMKNPEAAKLRPGSFQQFATFVSSSKADLDPKHTDVAVQSDGTIATVYFRFHFWIGGKETNQGWESWQLVKTEAGWRIAALCYSSDPDA